MEQEQTLKNPQGQGQSAVERFVMAGRSLKFRAWDGKQMHKVCRLGLNGFSTDLWSPSPVSCDVRRTANLKIMQFTGRLDKNGNEIYEGDIMAPLRMTRDIGPFIVFWNEQKAAFECTNGREVMIDIMDWHEREVTGNVFEP